MRENVAVPAGRGRDVIEAIRKALREDGLEVSISKLRQWFGVRRRTTYYYQPSKSPSKVQARFAEQIKRLIKKEQSFGYRMVAGLLGINENTVQRILQIKGWQVKKRPVGYRHWIEALLSGARALNQCWLMDLLRVWAGSDCWTSLSLVIDCHRRELLGWNLQRSGKATKAGSTLEQVLILRFGSLGRVTERLLPRSDNGLIFNCRRYTAQVLQQEFITHRISRKRTAGSNDSSALLRSSA